MEWGGGGVAEGGGAWVGAESETEAETGRERGWVEGGRKNST